MKLAMAKNSLFAILLRKPFWISYLLAAVAALAMAAMVPRGLGAYGLSAGLPFAVIGTIALVRQWRVPSAARVAQLRQIVVAMSWRDFSGALQAAFARDGYTVTPHAGPAADFVLSRQGSRTLVSCKRWKAAHHGIEPLRELQAAVQASGAHGGMFITAGALSDNAQRFAEQANIAVLNDIGLTILLKEMRVPAG